MLLSTFGASSVAVVIEDHENERTLLWQLNRTQPLKDESGLRRLDVNAPQKAAWLFKDFGSAWHVAADNGGEVCMAWATEPGQWPLKRFRVDLPGDFRAVQAFTRVTAVNMGLPGEWHGRMYLFDASKTGTPERTLHFLEALTEHVAPALTNVFLLRRLRTRAGAAERARVARELHDGAIQALFGIEMKLEAFRRAPDRSPAFVDAEVGAVQELLRHEVLSLRELMQALRPIELEGPDQLPGVLAALVERFRRDTGISARCVVTGSGVALPPNRALEIVRIVQEALANVRRHAHAQNVLVSLTTNDGEYRLVVEDDGRGFEFEGRLSARELDQRRIGPAVIKERARIAGAQLVVDSTPGGGARVELSFTEEIEHA
jgi:two-component system nitrate/nitrite sensor histidine kinase NarX